MRRTRRAVVAGRRRSARSERAARGEKPAREVGDDENWLQPVMRDSSTWIKEYDDNYPHMDLMASAKTMAVKNQVLLWQREAPDDKIISEYPPRMHLVRVHADTYPTHFQSLSSGPRLPASSAGCCLRRKSHSSTTLAISCPNKSKPRSTASKTTPTSKSSLVPPWLFPPPPPSPYHPHPPLAPRALMIDRLHPLRGVALNLTAANRVISVDQWWNSALEQQAWARAPHRPDQGDVLCAGAGQRLDRRGAGAHAKGQAAQDVGRAA